MALGYTRISFFETHCPQHGTFRIGIEEQESPLCPRCHTAVRSNFIAEGFTRRELPLQPQLLCKPIRGFLRSLIMGDNDMDEAPRRGWKKPKQPRLRKGWQLNQLRPLWR